MIATTATRVSQNTCAEVNERIRRQTEANVTRYAQASPHEINRRLEELDEEWDIERYLEKMAPTLTLAGLGLGLTVNKWFFLVPMVVQSFFLQHALQGWCPPIPFLRRMGIRTTDEIDYERNALKSLRGDYQAAYRMRHAQYGGREALQAAMR